MVEKEKFIWWMKDIADAYMDDKLLREGTINVWYKNLNDQYEEILEDSIHAWIQSQPKRPSISDLRDLCGRFPEMYPERYEEIRARTPQ